MPRKRFGGPAHSTVGGVAAGNRPRPVMTLRGRGGGARKVAKAANFCRIIPPIKPGVFVIRPAGQTTGRPGPSPRPDRSRRFRPETEPPRFSPLRRHQNGTCAKRVNQRRTSDNPGFTPITRRSRAGCTDCVCGSCRSSRSGRQGQWCRRPGPLDRRATLRRSHSLVATEVCESGLARARPSRAPPRPA